MMVRALGSRVLGPSTCSTWSCKGMHVFVGLELVSSQDTEPP